MKITKIKKTSAFLGDLDYEWKTFLEATTQLGDVMLRHFPSTFVVENIPKLKEAMRLVTQAQQLMIEIQKEDFERLRQHSFRA